MYEAFFGLQQRPFPSGPCTKFYFAARAIDDAFRALSRLVERDEGIGLVVGGVGTGKTLVCHLLVEKFSDRFSAILLASGRLTSPKVVLQHILFELKLPYRQMDEGELRLSLLDYLEQKRGNEKDLLLAIDEAHSLPLRVLEELRLLSCLVRGGRSRVRLIFSGLPRFEERLAVPRLEALNQRIAVRCYLDNLSLQETVEYVAHQLSVAGTRADAIFSDDALRAIHRYTDGIPRLVNQLCDHAMILACADGRRTVDAALLEEAWCDLQRLPLRKEPQNGNRESQLSAVIEFGTLDDSWEEPIDTTDTAGGHGDENFAPATPDSCGPGRNCVSATGEHEEVPSVAVDAVGGMESRLTEPAAGRDPEGAVEVFDHAAPAPETGTKDLWAVDPFDGEFAQEEIVLDRFAEGPLPAIVVPPKKPSPAVDCEGIEAAGEANQGSPPEYHPAVRPAVAGTPTPPYHQAAPQSVSGADWEEDALLESLAALWSQPVLAGHGIESPSVFPASASHRP